MNTIVTLRRAALGVVLLSTGLAAVAFAHSNDATPTRVKVEYGDLDLAKPQAAEMLYRRIASAARRACDEPSRGTLREVTHYRMCYQMAVSNAVAKVNANTLTALHRAKTQRATPS